MNFTKIAFSIIEFIAFILPALPPHIEIRLTILFIYFISHCFKLQKLYLRFKFDCISNT